MFFTTKDTKGTKVFVVDSAEEKPFHIDFVIGMSVGTYPPALPKWEGGLSVDKCVDFPKQCLVSRAKASPPWGRRERGSIPISRGI